MSQRKLITCPTSAHAPCFPVKRLLWQMSNTRIGFVPLHVSSIPLLMSNEKECCESAQTVSTRLLLHISLHTMTCNLSILLSRGHNQSAVRGR